MWMRGISDSPQRSIAARRDSLEAGHDSSEHSLARVRDSTLLLVLSGIERDSLTARAGVPRAQAAATARQAPSEWSL